MVAMRGVAGDGFLNLAFSPAVDIIGYSRIVDSPARAAVIVHGSQLIGLGEPAAFNCFHQEAVAGLDEDRGLYRGAIHLEQDPVRRSAVVQSGMGHNGVKALISKGERLAVAHDEFPARGHCDWGRLKIEERDIRKAPGQK